MDSLTKHTPEPVAVDFDQLQAEASSCAVMIVTAGFEERARAVFDGLIGKQAPDRIIVIRYDFDIPENDKSYQRMRRSAEQMGESAKLREVALNPKQPDHFQRSLSSLINSMGIDVEGAVWLDISGLPMWAICSALRTIRFNLPYHSVEVFYTEARLYFPTQKEYQASAVYRDKTELPTRLPDSLTSEMAENLILEAFSGVSLREHTTCLILFAGYETHRSLGVIEEINPTELLIVYGLPGRPSLKWRLEMSKMLHSHLLTERPTAEESVSTLDPFHSFELIETYYHHLYDNYNVCIAPVCSKMQAVGSYLAWERYKDIQIVFPLPVKYLPNRFSKGAGKTFRVSLPPTPGLALIAQLTFASKG